jgi:hypothetical protein
VKDDDKPFVFVIMPFDPEWSDVYDLGIKPACIAAGARCERVDEQMFLENILDRIYGQIEKADFIVAEMTGRNPNVFYEAGYARGVRKPTILLTQQVEDIPFDLRHYPHIVYGNSITTLKTELRKKIKWCIDDMGSATLPSGWDDSLDELTNLDRVSELLLKYFRKTKFRQASFKRLRTAVNATYTDDLLFKLIDAFPQRFRRVTLSGGVDGLALVDIDAWNEDAEQ